MKIKVMHDWAAYPLWWDDPTGVKCGDFNPNQLNISPWLSKLLINWANSMNDKLDWKYPPDTVISYWDILKHDLQGLLLTQLLKLQVKEYRVYYHKSIKDIYDWLP